mmetsp:Transcript_14517/g.16735  ORF Transcript_14517/g.16735 Transcript_14517/m.16735 type:complete len:316 (-) Transcript_14517:359-1306(-)
MRSYSRKRHLLLMVVLISSDSDALRVRSVSSRNRGLFAFGAAPRRHVPKRTQTISQLPAVPSRAEGSEDGVLSPDVYQSIYTRAATKAQTSSSDDSFESSTPWDIGGPQPTIRKSYQAGDFYGRILDCGCGAGENAVYLAQQQLLQSSLASSTALPEITSVVGFDLVPEAIDTARTRAISAEVPNGFLQFHALSCDEINVPGSPLRDQPKFDVAIDSALLHCLSDTIAQTYVSQLSQLLKPQTGRVFVGCFNDLNPEAGWSNPRRLSEGYLRELFCEERGFEIVDLREVWWDRPSVRGSNMGSCCMAYWMEARRL